MDLITRNSNEDGYSIVQSFKAYDNYSYKQTIKFFQHGHYLGDMYSKYKDEQPIWVLLEVMSFGTFSRFVEFYYEQHPIKAIKPAYELLKYAKNLRNAAAHSNTILVNLFSKYEHIKRPIPAVVSIADTVDISRRDVTDMKINDLVCLFYLHHKYNSQQLNQHTAKLGKQLFDLMNRHKDYYASNSTLQRFFTIYSQLLKL